MGDGSDRCSERGRGRGTASSSSSHRTAAASVSASVPCSTPSGRRGWGRGVRGSAIELLHQRRNLLLREGHERWILPRLRLLKELPQRLYVVDQLHVNIGPGEVRIAEHFECDDVLLFRARKHR